MMRSRDEIIQTYRERARRYDFTANLYYLVGFREWSYRKQAVHALRVHSGDSVVEIGCGTGLNFPLIEAAIGPEGKLIGVDLTDAMLARAEERVKAFGWSNVELVRGDATSFKFPRDIAGVISTFALTLVPAFDGVIRNAAGCLASGKRMVILDFKLPSNRLVRLAPLAVLLTKPFAVSLDLASRHPWESMTRHFGKTSLTELYGGFAYVAVGEKTSLSR
jgi:ubiquinone/menaquinone biosynthesis C-methylase UbiE